MMLSLIYKFDKNKRNEIVLILDKLHNEAQDVNCHKPAMCPYEQKKIEKKINSMYNIAFLKFLFLNILNMGLMSMLLLITATFTSIFPVWQNLIIILWGSTIVADFIIMEVIFEIIIWLFWVCRANHLNLSKCLLGIKNLRNF
jgi:hypothetical protein